MRDQKLSNDFPTASDPIVRAELTGDDTASDLGITVKSGSPVLALCRKLVEAGHDPNTPLEAIRNGTLAVRVKSIGLGVHLKMGSTGSGTPIFAYAGNGDIGPPIRFPGARLGQLRCQMREEVGVAALIVEPTKQCDRLVAGHLDRIDNLETLLRAKL